MNKESLSRIESLNTKITQLNNDLADKNNTIEELILKISIMEKTKGTQNKYVILLTHFLTTG